MGLIQRMARGSTVTVTRFKTGAVVNGKFSAAVDRTFSIVASVQPLGYKELVREDIGDRTKEMVRIYSEEELLANDNDTQQKGDVVMIGASKYEVQKVEKWIHLDLPHFKAIAARVNK